MTEETKMILERLDSMSQDIKETQVIAMEARDAANESKVIAMEAIQIAKETKKMVEELDKKVVILQATMENELRKQIGIIGEAHDFLKMKLDQALNMEKERERMWLEILSLRMDMRKVKEKLCIA